MISICRPCTLAFLAVLCFVSCTEDRQLVAKREKQKAEIIQLKGELALIEEKLKSLPPDVSKELTEAKKQFAKQSAEVEGLESEIAGLEAAKRSLETEFEAYQRKYQTK